MLELLDAEPKELNFRQRWASYLTIAVAIAAVVGSFFLRSSIVNATERFENKQAGVAARYPSRWLLAEGTGDFVFRVQDPAAVPFKTMLQVALVPVGPGTRSALDVLNPLNISRAASLPAYSTLRIAPRTLPNGVQATEMTYAFAASEVNPALQTVPVIVRAIDVVVLRSNQAVIITYQADAESFERNRQYFETFLRTLEF